ncbi:MULTISPECIES: GMC oxidoreductase [unclassified Sinorhizobium]|uniref:GMC family oxidoreductase n=1 Tax=unclassified Sinorhizobium TaxID=2613772 RepID=UPI003525BB1B
MSQFLAFERIFSHSMFVDLDVLPDLWCEVCIVGAGPVGLALGLSLASKGVRTLMVESGGDRPRKRSRDVSALASYNDDHHHSSEATVVRALGGTSLRWGGRCVEFDDIDFEPRDYVSEGGWPIPHSALKPYYGAARKVLTADFSENFQSGENLVFARSRESWARIRNVARANYHALRDNRSLMICKNCTATQMHVDADSARLMALTCVARRKARLITAPFFVFAGGGRENTRLLLELQLQKARLFGGAGGPLGRFYMGHLAGEIASISFARTSNAAPFLFRVSQTKTVIRDRLQPTAGIQREHGLLNITLGPDSLRPDEVIGGNGAASLFLVARHIARRARDPVFRNSISVREAFNAHLRNILAHPMQAAYGSSRLLAGKLLTPERYPQFSIPSPTNTYLLRYHAEQTPLWESRIKLSNQKDANGCHRLDVDFRYSHNDFHSVVKAHYLLSEWLGRNSIGHLTFLKPADALEEWVGSQAIDGYHQLGLTRMSRSRQTGIVDGDCQVHDIPNLFIAGSSVFPTSSQANPTLAAVAMSLRLADHLASRVSVQRRHVELGVNRD